MTVLSDLVAFGVLVALRALSLSKSDSPSDSPGLFRRVILHFARDLGNQRAKCDNIRPKIFVLFGDIFGAYLELHQFVSAETVCGLSHISHASCGAHGVLQKIHEKCRLQPGFAHERDSWS